MWFTNSCRFNHINKVQPTEDPFFGLPATLEICINPMKITRSFKPPSWALPLVAAFALVVPLAGATLNINYSFETSATPAAANRLFGPKGDVAGAEYWNQGFAPSFTNLLDFVSGPTSVDMAITVSATYNVGQVAGDTPMPVLKNRAADSVRGTGNFITLTLSSLTPGDTYRVWVASGNPSEQTFGRWSTPNSTTTVGNQLINNSSLINPGAVWTRGNNYVLFEDVVVNAGGTLVVTGVSGDAAQLPLSGFQIIGVPEPTSALLGSLGLLALFRRRRA